MSALLTEEQLMEWTGYKRRSKVEEFLRREKIPFTRGKGNKILVTQAAVDRVLAGTPAANTSNVDSFF
ncbi:DUF4224 domain-containing protein [Cellvibrio mixtus]|uniref:DUF4224 domain-containing protein n=1 Tax=Cellvibrio mixtus TaxID=39650 RepID=UPI000A019E30|nr:DUF4224 domain-containing protein [Cellvibrio mixtus]